MFIIKYVLNNILNLINLLILVRCVLSFIPDFYNKFTLFIYKITDPILSPIQKIINKLIGGRPMYFDLSPIVVLFIIQYVIKPIIFML